MGKKFSAGLATVGVLLVVLAIVWWTVIGPMLTKLPDNIDTNMKFEGTMTLYMDPLTKQSLPAGQEMVLPITVDRTFAAVPDEFTSSTGVFTDTLDITLPTGPSKQVHSYALDRKTRKCVDSDLNWSYDSSITLEGRVGYYGPLFPGGLGVGDVREAFFNDPSQPFEAEVIEEIDDYNGLGITALKIDATREETPYNPVIAQAVLVQGQGLPTEMDFADFAATLAAKGLDLNTLVTALQTVVTTEEMQSLLAMMQQPVPLVYSQYSGDVLYIEKTTGATVGADFDRTTTVGPDLSMFADLAPLLAKYGSDPTVAQMAGPLMQLAGEGGTPVFNQSMSITDESEAILADSADDKIGLVKLAELWIPLIIVLVGGVMILLGGAVMAAKKGK